MFYNKLNEESEDVNDIIILNDEEGLEIQFQFLDLIEYSGRDFVVQDDNILEIVYAIFKHKFKDQFDFLD